MDSLNCSGLTFTEKDHIYKYNGKTCKSVTTFIDEHKREFDEDKIANKLSRKTGVPASVYKIEWKKKCEDACLLGNTVHEGAEYFGRKWSSTKIHSWNPEYPVQLQGVEKYILDNPQFAPVTRYYELPIVHPEYLLAGTIDLLILDNGLATIIDWKTNKNIDLIGVEKMRHPINRLDDCDLIYYALQLNLYAAILELSYSVPVQSRQIIWLDNKGGYTVFEIPRMDEFVDKLLKKRGREIKVTKKD